MDYITVYTVLFCAMWVVIFLDLAWTLRTLPNFHEEVKQLSDRPDRPDRIESWPRLSVMIPARNEAGHIETALNTVLKQDYPNLEIIVMNDRSTDGTGDILKRLAAVDSRVQLLQIESLPSGWLGKVNALHQGVQRAKGDWYLFTDADVRFEPGVFQRAMRYVEHHGADHLVFLPRVICQNFFLDIVLRMFGLLYLLTANAKKVNKPDSKTPFGVGAFNLVSADKFRQTPGFEWLRLETADDYGLGVMLKNAGSRTRVAIAEEVSVPWYESLGDMFRGLEKNLFGVGSRYSWSLLLIQVLGLWALFAAPWMALIAGTITVIKGGSWVMLLAAAAVMGCNLLLPLLFLNKNRADALSLLFFPFGILLITMMMLWSAYRCLVNGGIHWRGTHYSLSELRAGQRVKF